MDEHERERLTDVAGILQRQEQIARLQGIQREVSALRQDQADANNKPQCPVCGGRLNGGFRKCKHCATDLIWLDGVPGEPEKEDELRAKVSEKMRVENERRQLAEAQLQRQEQATRVQAQDQAAMVKIVGALILVGFVVFVYIAFMQAMLPRPT